MSSRRHPRPGERRAGEGWGVMTHSFVGECIGGPLDGKRLAHWQKSKKFYSPMQPYGSQKILPVMIGEYRLNDFGQWHWWQTEAGKAIETLERIQP